MAHVRLCEGQWVEFHRSTRPGCAKTPLSATTVAGESWRGIDGGLVQGIDREQAIDEYVAEGNPVPAVDAFVDRLDLDGLGFNRVQPLEIGRPWL